MPRLEDVNVVLSKISRRAMIVIICELSAGMLSVCGMYAKRTRRVGRVDGFDVIRSLEVF
jgi:hypothetical protein